jgi:hypothetical protein
MPGFPFGVKVIKQNPDRAGFPGIPVKDGIGIPEKFIRTGPESKGQKPQPRPFRAFRQRLKDGQGFAVPFYGD